MRFVQRSPVRSCVVTILSALLFACGPSGDGGSGGINDATKARTEAVLLEEEVAKLDRDLRQLMRKIIADADGQQIAGNLHLSKDRYTESVDSFKKAAALYRKAIAAKEKIIAEGRLSELEALIPADPRMARLRKAADALPWPAKEEIDLGHGVKIELVRIRPASFVMGSESGNDDEKPVHEVTFSKPFYMGKTEFTQAQWQAVMGSNPSHFTDHPNNPVEQVSWDDCQRLLGKLGEKVGLPGKFRLPTEAEWEYACRAGSTTKFYYGDNRNDLGKYAWHSQENTHPVAQKKANAWGLYDMHGNVWEWCSDWQGGYPSGAVTDPTGPADGLYRVLRGGSWRSGPGVCRSADRNGYTPGVRGDYLGFRVVLDF